MCAFVLLYSPTGSQARPCGAALPLWYYLTTPKGYEANRATQATDTQGRGDRPDLLPINHRQGGRGSNTPTDHPDRLTGSPLWAALYPLGLMHPKGYEATGRHRRPTHRGGATAPTCYPPLPTGGGGDLWAARSPCGSPYHRGVMATTSQGATIDREGGGAIPRPTTPTGSHPHRLAPVVLLSILWG